MQILNCKMQNENSRLSLLSLRGEAEAISKEGILYEVYPEQKACSDGNAGRNEILPLRFAQGFGSLAQNDKQRARNNRFGFLIIFLGIIFLASATPCFAKDISFGKLFGISHPDKKTSPSAIAVYGGHVYVSYIREEGEVYLTVLSEDGKVLRTPVRVNGNDTLANGIHQSPAMSIGPNGEIYITWVSQAKGNEFAADIRFASSMDGGMTFQPSAVINDNPQPSPRGFESIAVGTDGTIYIAWLDSRDKVAGVSAAYFSRSTDHGRTFVKNIKLDDHACPCCRTAVAAGPDNAVYVSWRKVFDNDIRDMAIAGSSDSGRTFQKPSLVSADRWAIRGCPHRGPSMGVDEKGIIYYTWYTEGNDGLPAVYLSLSKDSGRTFSKKRPLPSGDRAFPDHPRLAVGRSGNIYIVWEEKTPVLSRILFASFNEIKGFSMPKQLSEGARRSYEPVIGIADSGAVFAGWVYDEIRFAKVMIYIAR